MYKKASIIAFTIYSVEGFLALDLIEVKGNICTVHTHPMEKFLTVLVIFLLSFR